MENYEDMEEEGFWYEIQEISGAFQEIVHKYGMQDRIISAVVVGLLETITEDQSNMKAFFNYNMQTMVELEIITDFMRESFTPPDNGPDIADLLNGLGISLN